MTKTETTAKHRQVPPAQFGQLKMTAIMANKICPRAQPRSPGPLSALDPIFETKIPMNGGQKPRIAIIKGDPRRGWAPKCTGLVARTHRGFSNFFPQPTRPNRSRPSIAGRIKNTVIFKKRGYLGARKPYISKPAIRGRTA